MRDFIIMTDSCADLSMDYIKEKNIPFVSLKCLYNGNEYLDDFGQTISYSQFFQDIRKGALPKTSQPSSQDIYDRFLQIVKEEKDIVYLCVSSGLSGTFNGANVAKNMILEDYPEASIDIIDTLTASLGEGLIVMKAIDMKEKGKNKEEILEYIKSIVLNVNTYILVDDLSFLKRGGRISNAAAALGMVLHVKPILTLNHEGKVMPILKIKGRKKSIKKLVEIMKERIENPEEEVVTICHGDCIEEALELKEQIIKEVGVKEVIINYIGNAVGAYSGADALAVFFLGKERQHHII